MFTDRPAGRMLRIVGAVLLAAVVTAGCATGGAQNQPEGKTRVFKADNGKVTIPANPQRIVATGYAVPTLIELDAPLVGISTWKRSVAMFSDKDRKTYKQLPKVAGEVAAETNYEAVAKANPDLIVIGVPLPFLGDINMKRLKSIAPVVAIGPTLPSEWREVSRRVADAAGVLDAFHKAKAAYEAKADKLSKKYAEALQGLKMAHLGEYGSSSKGNFQREYNGSWGTNIANDIGADYYGKPKTSESGSSRVSEYLSIEELPKAFGEAEAITYSVQPDGSIPASVQYVMDTELWKNLPAVQAGHVYPIRYTEAATYEQAMLALEAIDKSFAPMLDG